ncbi:EAL domain-containing protein [Paraliobacillus sp. X-1268]|uniref:EAL domain-containing protein n=1 Tax=Paraliobacillus sp. X-1268 TaxID=2213193 RepID=UPI000E3E0BAB|nr:EAL domain-containing protein [Paraliobacillus sp. X-1268]
MKPALRISAIYLISGTLWIVFSDYLLQSISQETIIQTYKGFIYVLATAILLFFMVRQLVKKLQDEIDHRLLKEQVLFQVISENERFRHLFEQAPSGMMITDPSKNDNPLVYVNDGFEKVTGYKSNEVIGKNPRFLQGKATSEESKDKIKQALIKKESIQLEIQNYKKDGSIFWNELKITPIFNDNNQLNYLTGIQNDITEKKNQTILIKNQLDFVKTMLSTTNHSEIFSQFTQTIERHLNVPCTILRMNEDNETYQLFASTLVTESFKKVVYDFFGDKLGDKEKIETFTKKTLVVEDILGDERFKAFWPIAKNNGYRSFWSTPIKTKEGETIGIFKVYKQVDLPFTELDLRVLESYSSIFAMAMQNVQYNEKLQKSERRYRLIGENSSDMICLLDEQLKVEYFSPSNVRLLGAVDKFVDVQKALTEESLSRLTSFIEILREYGRPDTIEVELKAINDTWHSLDISGSQFYDSEEQQTKILLVARDITERKEYENRLNRLLYYDPLTQLPNNYYFKKTLKTTINNRKPFNLLLLDFDQMKEIRSLYGGGAEEIVLTKLADVMKRSLAVTMIARTGESEFSVLLEAYPDLDELKRQVKGLLRVLEGPWHYHVQEFVATVSIGIVYYNDQSADTMRFQAEWALQTARKKGKHRYHIYLDEVSQGTHTSISIQNDLYHALDRNEFKLLYQPQVNVKNNNVDGVEALIRWEHRTLGMISPGEFIPIAEDTGLIIPISEWIIKEVCLGMVQWIKQGKERNASINISYRQMEEEGFVDKVKAILAETKCPANRLTFEITENMLMNDLSLSLRVLKQLKAVGIQLSVDDFGIGYSSLSYLKKFPIDCLKIDRAFVRSIHEDPNDFAIVQAIMEMSRALGLKVVAEGTETEANIRILQKLGCDNFQGYWFSRPVDCNELEKNVMKIYQEKLPVFS